MKSNMGKFSPVMGNFRLEVIIITKLATMSTGGFEPETC
jgi:hypothetical protein